jgi:hypothetical protein
MSPTADDVSELLRFIRPLHLQVPQQLQVKDGSTDAPREYPFVPQIILNGFASMVSDESMLHRLFRQDWAEGWHGWQDANQTLGICDDDHNRMEIALEYVQQFSRISLQNVDIVAKTDFVRRREIESEGKRIGTGLVHGNNECFADSFLQLLAYNDYVDSRFYHDRAARKESCRACRDHLTQHENIQLRPKQRTDTGEIADASDAEHDQAFLQHDVHAEEIASFFVRRHPGKSQIPPEGLITRVFTRWDSQTLPCNSVIVARELQANPAELDEPTIAIELFNDTVNGFTGCHYDPIFPSAAAPKVYASASPDALNPEDTDTGTRQRRSSGTASSSMPIPPSKQLR